MFSTEEWNRLIDITTEFLVERGAIYGPTDYSSVNGMLGWRAGRNFDLGTWEGQHGLKTLLAMVNDKSLPVIEAVLGWKVLLSTLVMCKNGNDVGRGYYAYAREHGLLQSRNAAAEVEFFVEQLKLIREYCRRVRGSACVPDGGLPLAGS